MKVSKLAGCGRLICGLFLFTALLAGCQGPKYAEVPGLAPAPAPAPAAATGGSGADAAPPTPGDSSARVLDTISVGDNLVIVFSDLPKQESPIKERVREDGTIRLLQNQVFVAAGKMRGDLEKEIHKRYVPDYYRTMTVTVTPEVNMQFYYVYGEVRTPDRQVWLARITVLKAIASANGFTDFSKKTAVQLTRTDGTKYTINCPKAQKDPRLDLEVYPGDNIYVPRKSLPWQR